MERVDVEFDVLNTEICSDRGKRLNSETSDDQYMSHSPICWGDRHGCVHIASLMAQWAQVIKFHFP